MSFHLNLSVNTPHPLHHNGNFTPLWVQKYIWNSFSVVKVPFLLFRVVIFTDKEKWKDNIWSWCLPATSTTGIPGIGIQNFRNWISMTKGFWKKDEIFLGARKKKVPVLNSGGAISLQIKSETTIRTDVHQLGSGWEKLGNVRTARSSWLVLILYSLLYCV